MDYRVPYPSVVLWRRMCVLLKQIRQFRTGNRGRSSSRSSLLVWNRLKHDLIVIVRCVLGLSTSGYTSTEERDTVMRTTAHQ